MDDHVERRAKPSCEPTARPDRKARRGFILALLFAAIATPAIHLWFATAGKAASPADPLKIVLATPTGDQDVLYAIDVTFSEPVVALGTRGERQERGPIRFQPELKGTFTWVGTSAVSFVLSEPPPEGKTITCVVGRGLKSLDGSVLPADHTWTINYRRPRLIGAYPRLETRKEQERAELEANGRGRARAVESQPASDPIVAAFSAPLEAAQPHLPYLEGAGGVVPTRRVSLRAGQLEDVRAMLNRPQLPEDRILAVMPVQPLSENTVYKLVVPASMAFRDRELTLAETLFGQLRLPPEPSITGLSAHSWDGTASFRLTFSTPTEPQPVFERLRLTPSPPNPKPSEGEDLSGLRFEARFRPGSTIRIEVPPGWQDLDGRRSTSSFDTTITLPHAPASLTVEPRQGLLIPGPEEAVRISACNVRAVEVRLAWIPASEMPAFLSEEWWSDEAVGTDRVASKRWITLEPWTAPARSPDSLHVWYRRISQLPGRPADAQGLLLVASAARLFESPDGGGRAERRRASLGAGFEGEDLLVTETSLQIAPLGISARMGSDRGLLWVTDLRSGEPVAGARVSLWQPRGPAETAVKSVWQGQTDPDGLAWTPGAGHAAFALAERGSERVWLRLTAHHPYAGRQATSGFLFTDRPIYRPGESIHWKAFLRHVTREAMTRPDKIALDLKLESWSTGWSRIVPAGETAEGAADGTVAIPPDAPTGHLQLSLLPRSSSEEAPFTSASVQVEAFRAPRFSARIAGADEKALSGQTTTFTGQFRHFGGAALGQAPITWTLLRQPWTWRIPGYMEFSTQDEPAGSRWSERYWRGPERVGEGTAETDAEGRFTLPVKLELPPEQDAALVTFEAGARDQTDQSAFDRFALVVLRGPLRPAVRADWEWSSPEDQGTWQWVVSDTAGTLVPNVPTTVELIYRDWKTVRVRRVGGRYDFENTPYDSILVRREEVSSDTVQSVTFPIPRAGYYLVRVRLTEPDGTTLAAAEGRYFSGEAVAAAPREAHQWLPIDGPRRALVPGDTAEVIIPAPEGGAQGLMVVESDGILEARRLRLEGTARIPVRIGDLLPPGIEVEATVIGPDPLWKSGAPGRRVAYPYFATGSHTLRLSTEPWRAEVKAAPERTTYFPGEEVGVEVFLSDQQGRPLSGEVTLAVVDEAVLALVAGDKGDPLESLFPWRGGGTSYADTRYSLRLPAEGEKGSPGGGGAEMAGSRVRRDFRPTAYWNPRVRVGPDGRAVVRFTLPDELTSYRIRATAAADSELFAVADTSIRIDKPLFVEPAVPRLVRVGDAWSVGAVVMNRGAEDLEVRVSCTVTGARLKKSGTWKGRVEGSSSRRLDFPVEVSAPGQITYTLEAEGRRKGRGSGGSAESAGARPANDAITRSLMAELPVERITEVVFDAAAPVSRQAIALDSPGIRDAAQVTARLAVSLAAELDDAVRWLEDYEHLCLEQIDSRILGLLARRDLADRFPPDTTSVRDQDAAIQAGLHAIARYAGYDEFRLWEGRGSGGPYLDAYTAFTLQRLEAAGFAVPPELRDQAFAFLESRLPQDGVHDSGLPQAGPRGHQSRRPRAGHSDDRIASPDIQAFICWVLVSWGKGDGHADILTSLYENRDQLGTASKAFLAMALAAPSKSAVEDGPPAGRPGDTNLARAHTLLDEIRQKLSRSAALASVTEDHPGWGRRWFSFSQDRIRATATTALALQRLAPEDPFLPMLVNWLLSIREHGRWPTTHENAFALECIRSYVVTTESLSLPLTASLTIGETATGQAAVRESATFTESDLRPRDFSFGLDQLTRPSGKGPAVKTAPIVVETSPEKQVYYQIRFDRARPALESAPQEEGLMLYREYVDAASGEPLERITPQSAILVHLALAVPHPAEYLVVEDPLPAGLEAVNLNLRNSPLLTRTRPGEDDPPSGAARMTPGEDQPDVDARVANQPSAGSLLPVTHKEIRDGSVRLYADEVRAGIYHIYYPVAATSRGTFRTPGARAELMYSPDVYATSGAETVVVR